MSRDRDVKMLLGFSGDKREVEKTIPDDEPAPWDLRTGFHTAGRRHRRLDAEDKVTGRAKYTYDINLPGLLVGGFVRCPHAHARVVSLDLAPALKHPRVHGGVELGRRTVRYADQPVAALAAEDAQALEEALDSVQVEYEVLPHAARYDMAVAPDAPRISRRRPNVVMPEKGSNSEAVSSALETAHKVVEATCSTQVQTHSSLEPHGMVARWEGDRLTVWASTQSTFGIKRQLGRLVERLGVRNADITVITEYMGGGFGSKFSAGYIGRACVQLARETGRPVKIMLDRREEHTDTGNRPSSVQEMKLGVTGEGGLGPYRVSITGTGGVGGPARVRNPMIYDWNHGLVDHRRGSVLTNAGSAAAFRAPGHPEGSFGMEAILDLAAEALEMDPLELRLRNSSSKLRNHMLRKGAELIGWNRRKPNGSARGRFRSGFGVGATRWPIQGGPPGEILCRIHRDGTVELRSGAQDIGTGTRTLIGVAAAEELGLPLDRVRVAIGNTNDPIGPGSGGSRTGPALAPAARQAAFLAGRDLRRLAAEHLEAAPEELVFTKGRLVSAKDAQKSLSFTDACRLMGQEELTALGRRKSNWNDAVYHTDVTGAQFAEVEVDCDLGTVRVRKIVAVHEPGLVMNRNAAESQVYGGVIQGISYALLEERHMDRHLGQMLNADLEMYKVAGPVDIPDIEVVLTDVAIGGSNASVAALGEPVTIPTAAAIAGGVHNALGKRVNHLPITPDKVLAVLEELEEGR